MTRLNYQKTSKENNLRHQATVNPPMKKKAPTLENAKRTYYGEPKEQQLWQQIKNSHTFLSGRFRGQDIGQLYKRNSKYFLWVLENNPQGTIAKQIVNYFNNNPDKI